MARLLPDNPPVQAYFELFDLPAKLTLNGKDLEQRYFRLSRLWHPDLFVRKSSDEQQLAIDKTALINDAYRTLRNPVKRAEYVAGASEPGSATAPPAELLEEVFELNMALEELRSGDEDARSQLETQRDTFAAMLQDQDRELAQLFSAYDNGSAGAPELRALLNRRKYIQNLVNEVSKALHVGN